MNANALVKTIPVVLCILALADRAYAYLGPGAGLGAIGSMLAIIVAVGVVLLGLIIYPIRRLRKRKSRAKVN
jgi:peptidoglycan/LPS O-acetylase OafA/YrhL